MSDCTCAISGPNKCPRHRALQDRYDHGVGPAPHSWQIPADPDQPLAWTGDQS